MPADAAATISLDISRAQRIHGWMYRKELLWLATMAWRADKIVEFGSHHGRSTRALADHARGIVYAIDPWNGEYAKDDGSPSNILDAGAFEAFQENLADHIASGKVVPLRMTSAKAVTFMGPSMVGADLVFIDGDHRYEHCAADIVRALGLVRDGGIVAGHDYGHPDWPGVKRAVDERFGGNRDINFVKTIWWVRV